MSEALPHIPVAEEWKELRESFFLYTLGKISVGTFIMAYESAPEDELPEVEVSFKEFAFAKQEELFQALNKTERGKKYLGPVALFFLKHYSVKEYEEFVAFVLKSYKARPDLAKEYLRDLDKMHPLISNFFSWRAKHSERGRYSLEEVDGLSKEPKPQQ